MMHSLLLFAHLLGAIVWLGGMVFAHFILRPTVVEQLAPPQRLSLMSAALGRFFRWVAVAVTAIVASGGVMMARVGFAQAPVAWHLMTSIGLLMALIFLMLWLSLYPRLRAAVAAQQWAAAAVVMNRIRMGVWLNLCLGVASVAAAAWARG